MDGYRLAQILHEKFEFSDDDIEFVVTMLPGMLDFFYLSKNNAMYSYYIHKLHEFQGFKLERERNK